MAKDIALHYRFNPTQPLLVDTGTTQQLFNHEYTFKGTYFNCVSLLDSLSKTRGIGLISNFKLQAPKERSKDNDLVLQVTLAATIK